jgi:hypothetical protein
MRLHRRFMYTVVPLAVCVCLIMLMVIAVGTAQADGPRKIDRADPVRVEPKKDSDKRVEPRPAPQREPVREEPKREPVRVERSPDREQPVREPAPVERAPQREEPKVERRDPGPEQRSEPARPPVLAPSQPSDSGDSVKREPAKQVDLERSPSPPESHKRQRDEGDRGQPNRDAPDRSPGPVGVDRHDSPQPDRERQREPAPDSGKRQPAPDSGKRDRGDVVGPRPGGGPDQSPGPGAPDRRPGIDRNQPARPGDSKSIDLDPRAKEKRVYPIYVERTPKPGSMTPARDRTWQPRKPDRAYQHNASEREYDVIRKYPIERKDRPSYHHVERYCGPPGYFYNWHPHWRPNVVWGFFFYYGGYCDQPSINWYVVVDPGWYYWSPYYRYHCVPGYCYWSPVIVIEQNVCWPSSGYYLYNYSAAPSDSVDDAVRDIKDAWFDGDAYKLSRRLADGQKIRVYFDNEYAYSMPSQDYYEMTLDAIGNSATERLEFDLIRNLSDGMVFLAGRHVFRDADDAVQTVYVSYTLKKINGCWRIVAVGTSEQPITDAPNRW